jgi:heptose I phosphotransferase
MSKVTEIEKWDDGRLLVNSAYSSLLRENHIATWEDLWSVEGEAVKKKLLQRGTERVLLKSNEKPIETYVKRYLPLPFKEYFKAITSFRPFFPSGAIHEWESIIAFHAAGIQTMEPIAAGRNPDGRTVLLSLGIADYVRASELLPELRGKKRQEERRRLILKIAELAGIMHAAKFAHQDFYLVHLFVKRKPSATSTSEEAEFQVLPIDLQRIIMGPRFSRRWRVKDLGQLLFSAMDATTSSDRLIFWNRYTEIAGTKLRGDKKLINSIKRKATGILNREIRKQSATD